MSIRTLTLLLCVIGCALGAGESPPTTAPATAPSPTTAPAPARAELSRVRLKTGAALFGEITKRSDAALTLLDLRSGRARTVAMQDVEEEPKAITDQEATAAVGIPTVMAWRLRPLVGSGASAKPVMLFVPEEAGHSGGQAEALVRRLGQDLAHQGLKVVDHDASAPAPAAGPGEEKPAGPVEPEAAGKAGAAAAVVVTIAPMDPPMAKYLGARWRALDAQTGEVVFSCTQRLGLAPAGPADARRPANQAAKAAPAGVPFDQDFTMSDEAAIKSAWTMSGPWQITGTGLALAQPVGNRAATASLTSNIKFRGDAVVGLKVLAEPGTEAVLTLWGQSIPLKPSGSNPSTLIGVIKREGANLNVTINDHPSTIVIPANQLKADTAITVICTTHPNYRTQIQIQEMRVQGQKAPAP